MIQRITLILRFVTYTSVREAETAIKNYNGFLFGGNHTLRVRLAMNKNNDNINNGIPEEKIIWGENINEEELSNNDSKEPKYPVKEDQLEKKEEKENLM